MKKIFFFSFVLLFLTSINSNAQWQNYTSMTDVLRTKSVEGGFWSATSGGAYFFNSSDSSYTKFTKSEGLSEHELTAVEIDGSGKIWFGTTAGVINIYDPETGVFKKILDIFNSDNTQKGINYLHIRNDTMFVASDFGVSLISATDFSFFDTIVKFGDFSSEIKVHSVTTGNSIYVSSEGGVAILKEGVSNLNAPESWLTYKIGEDIPGENIFKTVEFENTLFAASEEGLFKLTDSNWSAAGLNPYRIYDLNVSGDSLLAVIYHSLHSYKNGVVRRLYTNDNIGLSSITSVGDGGIFLSTNNGVYLLSDGVIVNYKVNGPKENSFNSVSVDKSGILWVGSGTSTTGGIYSFNGESWTNYNTSNTPEFSSNAFHLIYAGDDGKVYASNWGRGFSVYENNSFKTYNAFNTDLVGIPTDLNYVVIYGIRLDNNLNAWVLNHQTQSRNNLSVLTPDSTWRHFKITNPVITEDETTGHLEIDRYGTKWFAVTLGDRGLYYFNENGTLDETSDDEQGYVTESDGLNSNDIRAIAVDKRGEIWVGTALGLNNIPDPTRPHSNISSVFSLRQQTITAIAADPLNQKWVGSTAGVFIISPDGTYLIDHYDTKNSPLPTDLIRSIAIDENIGVVYIGTDYGLVTLKTPSIKPEDSFGELFVYPNPLIISDTETNLVTVDGLIKNTTLKILSITGKLINEYETPGGRVGFWDGRDLNGNFVPSGIYVITAFDEDANNIATTKIAVIRK